MIVTPNDVTPTTDRLFRGHSGCFGIPMTAWPFTGDDAKDEPIVTALEYLHAREAEGDDLYAYFDNHGTAQLNLPFCHHMSINSFLEIWKDYEGRMCLRLLFEFYAGYGGDFKVEDWFSDDTRTWSYRVTQSLGEGDTVESHGHKTLLAAWAEAMATVDRLLYRRGSKGAATVEPASWYDDSLEEYRQTA